MKFKVTMKDPDGVWNSIEEAARQSVNAVEGVSDNEAVELIRKRSEQIASKLRQWFEYSEYLTVEIDTEANTATVCPAK